MEEASIELILSVASFSITIYFWLVKARRERPQLRIYQIGGFRAYCRRHQQRDDVMRISQTGCRDEFDSDFVLVGNFKVRWYIKEACQTHRNC